MSIAGNLLEKALNAAGGMEEFRRKSKQYSENVSFIEENRDALLKKYDGRWIAVFRSEVVADGKEYEDVAKKIRHKELPIEEVAIKFISSQKMVTLF